MLGAKVERSWWIDLWDMHENVVVVHMSKKVLEENIRLDDLFWL